MMIDLHPHEVKVLHTLVRTRGRVLRKRKAKSDFVPEPGHVDMAANAIEKNDALLAKLAEYLTPEHS